MDAPGTRYKTSDLYYAAFLKVAGVKLVGTEMEGRRMFFLFEPSDAMRELKASYFNRVAKVDALSYVDEIKALKSMTHGVQTPHG